MIAMAKYNSKLTPEVCNKICEALAKGHSIKGACGYANISEVTYHNWYNRGQQVKSGKYKQFVCDVDNAKAKATCKVEDVVLDAIPTDVNTAKWWLVKHNPETYVDKQETKVDAKVDTDVTVNRLELVKQKRKELNDLRSNK